VYAVELVGLAIAGPGRLDRLKEMLPTPRDPRLPLPAAWVHTHVPGFPAVRPHIGVVLLRRAHQKRGQIRQPIQLPAARRRLATVRTQLAPVHVVACRLPGPILPPAGFRPQFALRRGMCRGGFRAIQPRARASASPLTFRRRRPFPLTNPKSESRNPKQVQNPKVPTTETLAPGLAHLCHGEELGNLWTPLLEPRMARIPRTGPENASYSCDWCDSLLPEVFGTTTGHQSLKRDRWLSSPMPPRRAGKNLRWNENNVLRPNQTVVI